MKSVALMQPYFFPYAGYFRLFAEVDQFVIYDCVQFSRTGRVHRTQIPGPHGKIEWLTLPLLKQSLNTRICALAFSPDARSRFDARLARLPWVASARGENAEAIREFLYSPLESVIDYLEQGLKLVLRLLGIDTQISRSSTLEIDPLVRGQDRVIAILRAVGGTRYLNSPGGRALYDPEEFSRKGIELSFLPPYEGPHFFMLHSLMTLPSVDIAV